MKFLTIRQPWASLIAVGVKTIETRPFSTKYRGPLAIHAGKAIPTITTLPGFTDVTGEPIAEGEDPCWLDMVGRRRLPMPLGAVVAVCDLVDVVPITDYGDAEHDHRDFLDVFPPTDHGPAGLIMFRDRCSAESYDADLPFGVFTPGRYAWLLDNVRPIDPVPMKGAQGLRDLPAEIEAQVTR